MSFLEQGFLNAGVALASMGRYKDALDMCAHVLHSFKSNPDVIAHAKNSCASIMVKYGADESALGQFVCHSLPMIDESDNIIFMIVMAVMKWQHQF